MKRLRSMRGLEIYRAKDGTEKVAVIWYANKGALREMVGAVGEPDPTLKSDVDAIKLRKRLDGKYRDSRACVAALRLLDQRRAEVKKAETDGVPYLPPKLAAKEAERERIEREKQVKDDRAPLTFETCAARFLADCAGDYSRPDDQHGRVRMLSRYFGGRMIDGIRKSDILAYFDARIANAPPFDDVRRVVKTAQGYMVTLSNGHPQSARNLTREQADALAAVPLSPRSPETEIATLSAMFNYLLDPAEDGTGAFPTVVRELAPTLTNPCIGWRPRRRRRTKAAKLAYTPKHRAVVATPEELGAILEGAANARQRALWGTAWYTFSRPESETCQLRLGDVIYSDDPRLRFEKRGGGMGRVIFRDTKTGEAERTVPLHPAAERLLKAMNLPPRPTREADETEAGFSGRVAAWESAPIFGRTKGPRKGEPWDRASYKRGWRATVERAQAILWKSDPEHRDIRGMWLRDSRKGGITAARSNGQDAAVIAKLAGHSTLMGDYYTQSTEENAAAAIASLPAPVSPSDSIFDRMPETGRS